MAKNNPTSDSTKHYPTFRDMFARLAQKYSNMPVENIQAAFGRTALGAMFSESPFIQNRRVKQLSSLPVYYGKNALVEMLQHPDENELPLRQVAELLTWTALPFRDIISTYSDLATYHWYVQPKYIEDKDADRDEFWRDYRLATKVVEAFDIKNLAHMASRQAGRMGKVFYYYRLSVDRAHNAVNHAFAQQLPSDWVKIAGMNNQSKYTVMFDMMYFMQPGTDPKQFGDLFDPYIDDFARSIADSDFPVGGVRSVKGTVIDLSRVNSYGAGNPVADYANGRWFYWVTLPMDKVFAFEWDDADRDVITPLAGALMTFAQIAAYEDVALEIIQNPLVSVLTGEIPYADNKGALTADEYKLSPTGIEYFTTLWNQLMAANNTGGIGLFLAPAENLRLQSLSEAPGASEIAGNGYAYAIAKTGMGALIPTDSASRAGVANISFLIKSQYTKQIYACAERMMNAIIKSLKLRYDFQFRMFGDLASDKEDLEAARNGMTLGILPDTLKYLALQDKTIFDDLSTSSMVLASGLMDKRLPLVSTYSAKQSESGLPPQGGRPKNDPNDPNMTEGYEGDLDEPTTT